MDTIDLGYGGKSVTGCKEGAVTHTSEGRGVVTINLGHGQRGGCAARCKVGAVVQRERGPTLMIRHRVSTQGDNGGKGFITLFT